MFFNSFILSFIPVFVAVDAFGVLPIFISLTEGMKKICPFLLGSSNENSGSCGLQRYLIYKLKGGQEDGI